MASREQLAAMARQVASYILASSSDASDPDPMADPLADPMADPVADPVADPLADPLANPVADPVAAGTVLPAGDPRLRASGKIPPVVTFQGRRAYEVSFKKGVRGPSGSNADIKISPAGVFPADQVRLRFRIWFERGFPWDPRTMRKTGGKLIGLDIGKGKASGGQYSAGAATIRVTWNKMGDVHLYAYPELRKASKGASWAQLDQPASLRAKAQVTMGISIPTGLKYQEGVWNDVELFVVLNDPGQQNGVARITVNGASREYAVRYRYDGGVKISAVSVHPFFGGGTADWAPVVNTKAYFADFEIGRS